MDEVIEKEIVDDLIYEVRGVQVMLDSDLARFVMMKKYMMQYVIATFISKKIGILDKKKVYISGTLLKDIGKKYNYINEVQEEIFINELLKRVSDMI